MQDTSKNNTSLGFHMCMAILDINRIMTNEDMDRIFSEFSGDLSPDDICAFLEMIKVNKEVVSWYSGFLAATRFYKAKYTASEIKKLEKMAAGGE